MRKAARNLTIFRHSSHAEWGHGIIVEENSSKLYLYFENGGRRAFVNDDRYRQLLVRAELSSEDATALRAKLEKFVPSPKKAASKKKAPSRSSAGHPAT